MTWVNMLTAWQWALLACIPPAIVLLYFLKLKRRPLEVPSTYLWRKLIEDLRVNSIWQRLRQNLLLLLQLLVLLLAAIALLRPAWHTQKLLGSRFIFLIDNSASMNASDAAPSRLAEAKERARELIDQMSAGDVGMVVSFADSANVEQPFTANRALLRRRLQAIRPTNRSTRIDEALRVASGLANPGRAAFTSSDTRVADSQPATLYIFSDGRFPSVEGFSLGNLTPKFISIGKPNADNIAITAFSTRRAKGDAARLQAFARIDNFTAAPVTAQLELTLGNELVDATKVELAPRSGSGVAFDLGQPEGGTLRLRLLTGGSLKADDVAWTAINRPRRSRTLLVTPGNEPLELALSAGHAREVADVSVVGPQTLADQQTMRRLAGGSYDLVIFDQCAPKEMPQANTVFIGQLPPLASWSAGPTRTAPQIIDIDAGHPLVQLIDLSNVAFIEGRPLKPPPGATVLVDSDAGPLLAIAAREGFQDVVLGAEIMTIDEAGQARANTDWPLRLSFPVFALNLLEVLGGTRDSSATGSVPPGQLVRLRPEVVAERLTIRTPSGRSVPLTRAKGAAFHFSDTEELGVYGVVERGDAKEHFAVNLFDTAESDLRAQPEGTIRIGYVEVKAESAWQPGRREAWKVLLAAALAVLLVEWYIYNRRVYI